jgi:hypothetical protein
MAGSLSYDLRRRVLAAVSEGLSHRAAAERFAVRANADLNESSFALDLIVFASAFSANRYPLGGRML